MGQVVRSTVTDVTQSALARRRTRKPRQTQNKQTYFTGNLIAFQQSQRGSTPIQPEATAARHGSTPVQTQPERQPVTESAAQLSDHHVPASNDSLISRVTTSPRFGRRSKIAAAVLAGLATGAVVGSFWTTGSQPEQQVTDNDFAPSQSASTLTTDSQGADAPEIATLDTGTQDTGTQDIVTQDTGTQDIVTQDSSPGNSVEAVPPEPQISLVPDSIPIVPVKDPVIEELAEKRALAAEYLEEIEWLHSQNDALQKEVEALDIETTELNSELLELELTVSALESRAEPKVETRTIYNFVNVPLGGSVEQNNYPTTDAGQNNYPPTESNDYYTEEDEYSEENEYYYNYGEEDGDVPEEFVDYHSGEVLETEDPSYSQSNSEQLIYDPATGYYINPNYEEPEDGTRRPSARSREFPPVLYPDDS